MIYYSILFQSSFSTFCIFRNNALQSFGKVNYVKIILDKQKKTSMGYGFLYMLDGKGDDSVERYASLLENNRFTLLGQANVFLQRHDVQREKPLRYKASHDQDKVVIPLQRRGGRMGPRNGLRNQERQSGWRNHTIPQSQRPTALQNQNLPFEYEPVNLIHEGYSVSSAVHQSPPVMHPSQFSNYHYPYYAEAGFSQTNGSSNNINIHPSQSQPPWSGQSLTDNRQPSTSVQIHNIPYSNGQHGAYSNEQPYAHHPSVTQEFAGYVDGGHPVPPSHHSYGFTNSYNSSGYSYPHTYPVSASQSACVFSQTQPAPYQYLAGNQGNVYMRQEHLTVNPRQDSYNGVPASFSEVPGDASRQAGHNKSVHVNQRQQHTSPPNRFRGPGGRQHRQHRPY